jgi:hypothetical protein
MVEVVGTAEDDSSQRFEKPCGIESKHNDHFLFVLFVSMDLDAIIGEANPSIQWELHHHH